MPTIRFIGEIVANGIEISLTELPTVNWEATDLGLKLSFSFAIDKSKVQVECQTNRLNETDVYPIWMRAFDLARGVVNLACFSSGIGAVLIMNRYLDSDGKTVLLLPKDDRLAALCTAFQLKAAPNPDLDAVLDIVLKEPPLFMAMDDLIVSITLPHHAAVNCGRAIDGLRKLVAPAFDTKTQWEAFRSNLRLTKDYLELITGTSTAPRHGDRSHIPGSVIGEVATRSWIVMSRFLEFRKRGNQPLPTSEFPWL